MAPKDFQYTHDQIPHHRRAPLILAQYPQVRELLGRKNPWTFAVILGCVAFGRPSRSQWQALLAAGGIGFGAAIGVHGLVGYLDPSHVGPAVGGAIVFALGMLLSRPRRQLDPA